MDKVIVTRLYVRIEAYTVF